MNQFPQWIYDEKGNAIALIIHKELDNITKTTFITPAEYNQQIGFVVYPEGSSVDTHIHLPIKRDVVGTSEVIIIRKGCAIIRLYDVDRVFVAKYELDAGDIILLINGWHGIDFLDDTVILEIKQGPYLGENEKVRLTKGNPIDTGK